MTPTYRNRWPGYHARKHQRRMVALGFRPFRMLQRRLLVDHYSLQLQLEMSDYHRRRKRPKRVSA